MDKEDIIKSIQKLKLGKDEILWVTFKDGLNIDRLIGDFSDTLKKHGFDNIIVFVSESLSLRTIPVNDAIEEIDRMIEGLQKRKEEINRQS